MKRTSALLMMLTWVACLTQAQVQISPDSLVKLALSNNGKIKALTKKTESVGALVQTGTEVGPTNLVFTQGNFNTPFGYDNLLSIQQSIPFPLSMTAKRRQLKALYGEAVALQVLETDLLVLELRNSIALLSLLEERLSLYREQDSIYESVVKLFALRYSSGEGNQIEYYRAIAVKADLSMELALIQQQIKNEKRKIQTLCRFSDDFTLSPTDSSFSKDINLTAINGSRYQLMEAGLKTDKEELRLAKSNLWPELQFGYTNQTLIGEPIGDAFSPVRAGTNNRYSSFTVGLGFNLWMKPQLARVKSASYTYDAGVLELEQLRLDYETELLNSYQAFLTAKENLTRFENESLPLARALSKNAEIALRAGNISFSEFAFQSQEGLRIMERYRNLQYQAQIQYNQVLINSGQLH